MTLIDTQYINAWWWGFACGVWLIVMIILLKSAAQALIDELDYRKQLKRTKQRIKARRNL